MCSTYDRHAELDSRLIRDRADERDGSAFLDVGVTQDAESLRADSSPACRYELEYVPDDRIGRHEVWLYEWVLEWVGCADVIGVDVDRRESSSSRVRVSIESRSTCSETEYADEHVALLAELETVGSITETDCTEL